MSLEQSESRPGVGEGELDDSDEQWEGEALHLLEKQGREQGAWLVVEEQEGEPLGADRDRSTLVMMSPRPDELENGDGLLGGRVEEQEHRHGGGEGYAAWARAGGEHPDTIRLTTSAQHSSFSSPQPMDALPPAQERLTLDAPGEVRPSTSGTVMSGGTTNRVGTGDSSVGRPQQPKISDLAGGAAMLSGMPSLSRSATRMQLMDASRPQRDAMRPLEAAQAAVLRPHPPTMFELAARGGGGGGSVGGVQVGCSVGDSSQGSWHGSWASRSTKGFESLAQMRMRGAPAGSSRGWDKDQDGDGDDHDGISPAPAAAPATPELPRRHPKFSEMARGGWAVGDPSRGSGRGGRAPSPAADSTHKADEDSHAVSPVLMSRDGSRSSSPHGRRRSQQDDASGLWKDSFKRGASPLRERSGPKRPPKMSVIAQKGWGGEGDKGSMSSMKSVSMAAMAARKLMVGSSAGSTRSVGSAGSGRRGSQVDIQESMSPNSRKRGAFALLPGGGRPSFASPMKKSGGALNKRLWGKKQTLGDLDRYAMAFEAVDVDGSGKVDSDELSQALTGLGFDVRPEEVQSLIREYSKGGKGEIVFKEFVAIMTAVEEKHAFFSDIKVFREAWIAKSLRAMSHRFKKTTAHFGDSLWTSNQVDGGFGGGGYVWLIMKGQCTMHGRVGKLEIALCSIGKGAMFGTGVVPSMITKITAEQDSSFLLIRGDELAAKVGDPIIVELKSQLKSQEALLRDRVSDLKKVLVGGARLGLPWDVFKKTPKTVQIGGVGGLMSEDRPVEPRPRTSNLAHATSNGDAGDAPPPRKALVPDRVPTPSGPRAPTPGDPRIAGSVGAAAPAHKAEAKPLPKQEKRRPTQGRVNSRQQRPSASSLPQKVPPSEYHVRIDTDTMTYADER